MIGSLIGTQAVGQTNEGTHFWLGFMQHHDIFENRKVVMITAKTNAGGNIRIPGRNWIEGFNVPANGVALIELPPYSENMGSELKNDIGVEVTAGAPVSVYIHQYFGFRSEAAVILPKSSLGDEYYVMSYFGYSQGGAVDPSEFLIVAVEDQTTISITLSDQTQGGRSAGTEFDIILDEGETYQVRAATADGDLTGTHIQGDKNFVTIAGNSWTQVPVDCPFRDNLMEQMYPVSTWGKKYVSVPNAQVNFDVFRILAAEDNSNVDVLTESGSTTYALNRGEIVEYQLSEPSFIQSDQPILVAQFNTGSSCNGHGIGDPSMVLLNSVEQTRNIVTLFNSSLENITENYINVIASTADFDNVTLDGVSIASQPVTGTVGPNNEFSYARIPVSAGAHTIESMGCGVIATAYGYGMAESYAYSGGASFNSINASPIPEGGCLNDTVFFDTQLPPDRYSVSWDLGDGVTTEEHVFSHFYPNLGGYPVQLIVTDECLGLVDTMDKDLMITLRQAVDTDADPTICEGESFTLSAVDLASARYEWNGPNEYFSEEQFPRILEAYPEQSGTYEVIGIISGCATFPAFAEVDIIPTPVPFLGNDTVFCIRGNPLVLEPGDYSSYKWQNGSTASSFLIQEAGDYSVEVIDAFGCVGEDDISIMEQCPTQVYVPNAFSPNADGINDEFQILGNDIISSRLIVFDRWGNIVFEGEHMDEIWNGTFNGKQAPTGTYIWILHLEGYSADGSIFQEVQKGNINLVR